MLRTRLELHITAGIQICVGSPATLQAQLALPSPQRLPSFWALGYIMAEVALPSSREALEQGHVLLLGWERREKVTAEPLPVVLGTQAVQAAFAQHCPGCKKLQDVQSGVLH